ncbi:hypothetical protein DZG01_24930 [Pseudomonas fluorescens]|nr:hypothetical protein DZG01_24930 [Pseudomonas fluorescens]
MFIFGYIFRGELFTWARRLNRLIASALIGFEFKDLQWSEYIEIFLREYNVGQLYQSTSAIAKHMDRIGTS